MHKSVLSKKASVSIPISSKNQSLQEMDMMIMKTYKNYIKEMSKKNNSQKKLNEEIQNEKQ